jgi:hypothetical protein
MWGYSRGDADSIATMADRAAQAIVDKALAVLGSHPAAPPLEILDLALAGRHGIDPNFEAPHTKPFADWVEAVRPLRPATAPGAG